MSADEDFKNSLDPADWADTSEQAHRMLDDMLDHIRHIREKPVWQPMPADRREAFRAPIPHEPQPIGAIHAEFLSSILPYGSGNLHPRFMGWVQGAGTVPGMLAEMLAAGLNANLGGRDHSGIEVERQLVAWVREIFGFPDGAGGIFVTGTSMANFMAVLVARTRTLGTNVRRSGLGYSRLRGYASVAVHACVRRAFDYAGLGSDALTEIGTDAAHRIDIAALRARIRADRAAGLEPFMVIASAGTVDVGAIDDLSVLAALCAEEKLWFHVDGAFGALGILSPEIAPRLKGIERADSIAFDFHKWGQVPYDAGFLLVRDGKLHMDTFASPAAYLRRDTRGLSAASPWPCDFGPDLSRGFRALKTWFTLKAFGTERLGAMMAQSCAMARHLEARVRVEAELELVSGAQLNIVCFRYRGDDGLNSEIVADMQEAGIAAPSLTTLNGCVAIRACFINHRTRIEDVDALVDATLAFGRRRNS
ncbi:MAG TPA: pyridoxal-dependent decarboxylase [Rhizomicrobium sp.]|nr:pyridoxal-dependent decarboxylase [Rhizomicrobium sp.]